MPADLKELASGSSILTPPSQPSVFTPPERPEALTSLAETIGKTATAYTGKREALDAAEAASKKKHDELMPPAVERLKKAAETPLPEAPTPKPEPTAPDISARPFLSGEGKNALQQVIQGLGLIVTSIAGARRAPAAALGALTGAMTGWAEGDAERASRDWHQYEGLVAKMNRENAMALKQYEIATARWGADQQAAQIFMQAKLAELGLTDYATSLAEKGYARTGQELATESSLYSKMLTDYNGTIDRAFKAWEGGEKQRHNLELEHNLGVKAKHAEDVLRQLKKYQDEIVQIKKTGASAQLDKQRLKVSEGIEKLTEKNRAVDESLLMIDDLDKAVTLLDAKGIIPKGATYADEGKAKVALQTSVGEPDVADAIQTVKRFGTSAVIRKELEMMGGKGAAIMRLKAIGEAEAGDILMPPKAWWDRFLASSRRVLQESKKMNAPVLKAYQETLQRLGPSLPQAEAPPVPANILEQLGATVEMED